MEYSFHPPQNDTETSALIDILCESFAAPRELLATRAESVGRENLRVLSAGDGIEAGLLVLPMGQWFGGAAVPMIGVSVVGVATRARGGGRAHALMSAAVNEMHDQGVPLSTLYPATRTLYRKSGYEYAGSRCKITLALREFAVRERNLRVTDLDETHHTAMAETYTRMASACDGYLDRHSFIWDRVYEMKGDPAHVYGVWNGERLEGYAAICHKPGGMGYNLALTDLVYTTPTSARRLLALLANHSSMCTEAVWYAGPSEPILHFLPEKSVQIDNSFFWMLRITHVQAALEARGYSPELRTELHFDLADDIIEGNAGKFVLTVEDGGARVTRGGKGSLRLDVRALASLYSGFFSGRELALNGEIEGDVSDVRGLESVFTGGVPRMADMF